MLLERWGGNFVISASVGASAGWEDSNWPETDSNVRKLYARPSSDGSAVELTPLSGYLMRGRRTHHLITLEAGGVQDDQWWVCSAAYISTFVHSLCVFIELLQAVASAEVAKQGEEGARRLRSYLPWNSLQGSTTLQPQQINTQCFQVLHTNSASKRM
jgi:hypothetical protein